MSKTLTKIISLVILAALIIVLWAVITKKRVIVIENTPKNYTTNASSIFGDPALADSLENKRINAIFLGIPGAGNSAPNLTDTLMILSINNETGKGFLLSIPRDLLVRVPGKNFYTKINSLYQEGRIDSVKTILREISGLDFDYDFVIDLEGVKKIIDELGGIDVFVENEIYDPAFPESNNSYELFRLEKGQHHLDGETAVKYIRTRHDPTGDFARMRRQQQVLIALKDKISSLNPLWNSATILNLWQISAEHFKTNLSIENIKSAWKMLKNIDLDKLEFHVLDQTSDLVVPDHTLLGNQTAYILRPKNGLNNYSEIKNYINNLIK